MPSMKMFGRLSGVLAIVALLVWLGLPRALNLIGLHAHYEVPPIELSGHRAIIITTSVDRLAPTDRVTGVASSEMTIPYYALVDAGIDVDLASIQGGEIPFEPGTLRWPVSTPADRRFQRDDHALGLSRKSIAVSELDISGYDIVFLAGGWGAAYDLGQSEDLGVLISEAYANGAVVGGVCHGVLGLLQAETPAGLPLVEGRRLTGVTDKQLRELGITFTPMHPERELRTAGAEFEAQHAFRDFFASHVVVDGRLVTGQNQNSGAETAHRMMERLSEDAPR